MLEFKKDDIIVQIGHPQKWRILEVQTLPMSYRVAIVNGVESCVTSFNTALAHMNFVKVGVWDDERGEIDEQDEKSQQKDGN